MTFESVARLTALAEPVTILAPGGTGKSTTVVQLAECMCAQHGPTPLLVPLGEWADRQEDFFEFILRRNAFGAFRRQHLLHLAYHGRLALLLDGWNELTPEARLRATNDLTALQRDYPQLGIVISSRRQALQIVGPTVTIDALSEDQQIELARALRGEEGIDLVDRAWRTPGVRELVGNPLYLSALLTLPPGAAFPETKEAVLRMFVRYNETAPDKLERLQRDTLGQHNVMLTGLAVEANRSANTFLSDTKANRAISTVLRRLSDDGQIGSAPQPRVIIEGLIGAHLLVRSESPNSAVSFQHQLFQEWYAAAEVEDLMLNFAAGNADAGARLRRDVLDQPSWEESILFACDRLSRASADGVQAVAAAVDETLGIDPLLAATMLERAADAVWLRSNTDDQIQVASFRAADPFHPGVLGADCEARLRDLPVGQRKIALSEIASNSGFDGMELAATMAAADPDPEVVIAVVEELAFRRADRHVNRILHAARDPVWTALGRNNYPDHLTDPQLDVRLATEREAARSAEPTPARLLHRIMHEKPADAEARITRLLGAADSDTKDSELQHAISYVYLEYPRAVAASLVARVAADLPLPYRVGEYLKDAPLLDTGPVTEAALDPSTPGSRLDAAAALIGPETVSALFDQLFATDDLRQASAANDQQLWKSHTRLVRALAATRQDVFVPVLMAKGQTKDPRRISLLAEVLTRHGTNTRETKPPINAAHRADLRAIVEGWAETLRRAPQPARLAGSKVASAAGRLADAELAEPLYALLERDLEGYAAARAERLSGRGQRAQDYVGYTRIYANALAAMRDEPAVIVLKRGLDDVRWGIDAAAALYEIWSANNPTEDNRSFKGWTDYSQHLSRRVNRVAAAPFTSDFAEAIFAVVGRLGRPERSEGEQRHALALAVTGLALPQRSQTARSRCAARAASADFFQTSIARSRGSRRRGRPRRTPDGRSP
jgi:hypothetical protein